MRKSPKVRVVSDASALVAAVLERGLTAGQVAEKLGLSSSSVSELLNSDKVIRLSTAAALRKNFGASVVRILDAEG